MTSSKKQKYVSYCNATRRELGHGHVQHAQKILIKFGSWYIGPTHRDTDSPTDRQIHS